VALGGVAGGLLDMVRSNSGFALWDQAVAQWGADHATAASTMALVAITQLGASWLAIPAVIAVGWYAYRRWDTLSPLWFMATVYVGHFLISNGLKVVIERERPPVEHLVGTLSSSFPSTHSGTAAAIWAAAALVVAADIDRSTRVGLGAGAVAIAALVASSRALLGVHWLTDVLAGAAIGWGWFLLVAIAFGGRALRLGEPVERIREDTQSSF
jgi:membrane-associated phospholipid phosphatase